MQDVKQVIVFRKDLNVRKGKLAAQVAHASMKVFLDRCEKTIEVYEIEDLHKLVFSFMGDSYWNKWLNELFTKVVVSCDSEDELDELYKQAKEQNIPCSMIVDAGLTEFNGVPTKTCIAIGPYKSEEINKITGKLKLL